MHKGRRPKWAAAFFGLCLLFLLFRQLTDDHCCEDQHAAKLFGPGHGLVEQQPAEEGGENDGDVDTYAPGEPVDEPSTREDRKKLNLKKTFSNLFPKKTDTGRKREAKERREPQKPSFFSKFLDWYMEPLNRRSAPETEYVDENGRRRRRRRSRGAGKQKTE